MKTFITIVFTITTLSAFATIHTVSNIDSSAQFSTIQAACDASNSGDSIYVSPSSIQYTGFNIIDKKLAVFGPGWSPFSGDVVRVSYCNLFGIAASGSEIHGLQIDAISFANSGINDITISRNKIVNGITFNFNGICDNYLIEGNWFPVPGNYNGAIHPNNGTTTLSNSIIRNNLFYNCALININGDHLLINHNLFFGPNYGFRGCSNLTITNNIIQLDANGTSFSTFNNNITYNTANSTPWNGNNNIDAGGNIANTNPQMVDQVSVNAQTDNPLLDFTIKLGPANNAGSDGLDIGLLFDKGKVTNWNYCRAAHLPYITEFNIINQNITIEGGYIKFNGKAKSN